MLTVQLVAGLPMPASAPQTWLTLGLGLGGSPRLLSRCVDRYPRHAAVALVFLLLVLLPNLAVEGLDFKDVNPPLYMPGVTSFR